MFKMQPHFMKDWRQPTEKYIEINLDKSKYKSEGQKHKVYAFYCM